MKALIAVDGTEGSKSALSVFKTMTREPECVVLVHVRRSGTRSNIDPPNESEREIPSEGGNQTPERNAGDIMSFCKKMLENTGRVTVTMLMKDGIPSEEILRAAGEERVDFIILGSSGQSLLRPAAGRVAGEVERNAAVPVLIARTNRFKKSIVYNWRGKEYAA